MSSNTLRETVSKDLETLEAEYREMVEQYKQLGRALEQQSGAIQYARLLLQKIDEQDRTRQDAAKANPAEVEVERNGEVLPV